MGLPSSTRLFPCSFCHVCLSKTAVCQLNCKVACNTSSSLSLESKTTTYYKFKIDIPHLLNVGQQHSLLTNMPVLFQVHPVHGRCSIQSTIQYIITTSIEVCASGDILIVKDSSSSLYKQMKHKY